MLNKNEKSVWDSRKPSFQSVGTHPHITLDSMFAAYFLQNVLDDLGKNVFYKRAHGFNANKDVDFFANEIMQMYKEYSPSIVVDLANEKMIKWDHGCADVLCYPGSTTLSIMTTNKNDLDKLHKLAIANTVPISKVGKVFAIATIDRELTITSLGIAGIPLEKGNYSSKVNEDYEGAIADFNSNTPSGCMTILNGEPGTGKTYLVRAMLMDVPAATFLLIPPTMIPDLSGPNLISLLLENRHSFSSGGPTILVLEDADYCLAPRKSDNMSAISAILNMGDGIFGSLFDIRILATTNAETQEIDPAILRAGRLSRRIDVNKLTAEEATIALNRILPGKKLKVNKSTIIAEVYKMARDNGWVPPQAEVSEETSDENDNYDD